MSILFSPTFLSSHRAHPTRMYPDQNTTIDVQSASETSSFQVAPTFDILEATPTRRYLLWSATASLISARLELAFVLCATFDMFFRWRHCLAMIHHSAHETRNQQAVGPLSLSSPAALEVPSRVSKSHPVSREMCSVRPPSSSRGQERVLSRISDLRQICTFDFTCRQVLVLVHGELFAALHQHCSLQHVHRLQVALDFAAVFRCKTIACSCSTRFTKSVISFFWLQLCCLIVPLSSRRARNLLRRSKRLFHMCRELLQLWCRLVPTTEC